jgi:hypothetical protein
MSTPQPATPTSNPADDLNFELKAEYDGLSNDLKKYFDTKQATFYDKSKSAHSSPDNYQQDRGEFLINQQIENINTYRSDVWNYLTEEFNKNTNEKYLNAKTHLQNQKDLARKKADLDKLIKKMNTFKSENNTNNRQKEIVLYEYNRRNDQYFILKIISLVLLVCIIITILINRFIPFDFVYFVLLIFMGLIVYIIYYLYIKNLGRSKRYWDKYEFVKPAQDFDTVQSLSNTQIESVDKSIDKNLDKYLDECRTKPTLSASNSTNKTTNKTATRPTQSK